MASIRKKLLTKASVDDVWRRLCETSASCTLGLLRDAVIDTKLERGERIVTFGNGMVVREPIVDIDDTARRLVWTSIGGRLTHYEWVRAGFRSHGWPDQVGLDR